MNKEQYNEYLVIVKKITKNDERATDLLHDVMVSLLLNEKYNNLPEKDKRWFFVRTITNQYWSKHSHFHRQYRKYTTDIDIIPEIVDVPYQEPYDMQFVFEVLQKQSWYDKGLFEMYLQLGSIKKVSQKTKIPIYSVSDTIKNIKKTIKNEWSEKDDN
jgi:hypothetical protein